MSLLKARDGVGREARVCGEIEQQPEAEALAVVELAPVGREPLHQALTHVLVHRRVHAPERLDGLPRDAAGGHVLERIGGMGGPFHLGVR